MEKIYREEERFAHRLSYKSYDRVFRLLFITVGFGKKNI